ncbi:hypothetical protein BZG36_02375 [Bifiguratus adelaidae]|uniref:Uncharacterized protein n=1 Tax=Bifiguratus adelaidae TaxID=1938954 RepID=A0A261Y163_9FUNG|nr:hypothetical protein BZG36_02375 [Bifiguratus adelaidae]
MEASDFPELGGSDAWVLTKEDDTFEGPQHWEIVRVDDRDDEWIHYTGDSGSGQKVSYSEVVATAADAAAQAFRIRKEAFIPPAAFKPSTDKPIHAAAVDLEESMEDLSHQYKSRSRFKESTSTRAHRRDIRTVNELALTLKLHKEPVEPTKQVHENSKSFRKYLKHRKASSPPRESPHHSFRPLRMLSRRTSYMKTDTLSSLESGKASIRILEGQPSSTTPTSGKSIESASWARNETKDPAKTSYFPFQRRESGVGSSLGSGNASINVGDDSAPTSLLPESVAKVQPKFKNLHQTDSASSLTSGAASILVKPTTGTFEDVKLDGETSNEQQQKKNVPTFRPPPSQYATTAPTEITVESMSDVIARAKTLALSPTGSVSSLDLGHASISTQPSITGISSTSFTESPTANTSTRTSRLFSLPPLRRQATEPVLSHASSNPAVRRSSESADTQASVEQHAPNRSSILLRFARSDSTKSAPPEMEHDMGREELEYRGIQVKEIKTTLKTMVIPEEVLNPMKKVDLMRPGHARVIY